MTGFDLLVPILKMLMTTHVVGLTSKHLRWIKPYHKVLVFDGLF